MDLVLSEPDLDRLLSGELDLDEGEEPFFGDLEGDSDAGLLLFGVGSLTGETLLEGDLTPGELLKGVTVVGRLSRSGEGLGEVEDFLGDEDLGTTISFSFGYLENPLVGLGLESGLLSSLPLEEDGLGEEPFSWVFVGEGYLLDGVEPCGEVPLLEGLGAVLGASFTGELPLELGESLGDSLGESLMGDPE